LLFPDEHPGQGVFRALPVVIPQQFNVAHIGICLFVADGREIRHLFFQPFAADAGICPAAHAANDVLALLQIQLFPI
jgi:hypothetical protein